MQQVAAMPDLHPGRGYPVGAAFFSVGRFHPALVGNDIGCGMALHGDGLFGLHAGELRLGVLLGADARRLGLLACAHRGDLAPSRAARSEFTCGSRPAVEPRSAAATGFESAGRARRCERDGRVRRSCPSATARRRARRRG
jgi:hypothetical protein